MRNSRIQKFTSDGVFICKWGTYGMGDGQFDWPTGVAVASDDSVYVSDSGDHSYRSSRPMARTSANGVPTERRGTKT